MMHQVKRRCDTLAVKTNSRMAELLTEQRAKLKSVLPNYTLHFPHFEDNRMWLYGYWDAQKKKAKKERGKKREEREREREEVCVSSKMHGPMRNPYGRYIDVKSKLGIRSILWSANFTDFVNECYQQTGRYRYNIIYVIVLNKVRIQAHRVQIPRHTPEFH